MDFNARNVRILLGIITFGIVLNWGMQNVHNLGSVVDGLGIVLRPVLIGCGLAFVLSVPMRAIERLLSKPKLARMRFLTRIKRPLAITLSFLLVIFILLFVTFMVVPGVINAITALIDELPAFFEQLKTWSADLFVRYPDIQAFQLNWDNIGAQIINFLKNTVIGLLDSTVQTVSNLFTGVFNAFIGIVIAINLLVQKEKIGAQIRKLLYSFLPERAADETVRIVRLTNSTFSHFITGQCTEAVIFGALCFVGLSLLRMPHTMMLSVLLGFSTLIPIFGATIATAAGFLVRGLCAGLAAGRRQFDLSSCGGYLGWPAGHLGADFRADWRRNYGRAGYAGQCACLLGAVLSTSRYSRPQTQTQKNRHNKA